MGRLRRFCLQRPQAEADGGFEFQVGILPFDRENLHLFDGVGGAATLAEQERGGEAAGVLKGIVFDGRGEVFVGRAGVEFLAECFE